MNDVFISYKVHNRKMAIDIYYQLKNSGFIPWFDQLIPKGTSWKLAIRSAIQSSRMVLCLLSKDALRDDWVYNQIKLARKFHKRIIFLFLEGLDFDLLKKYKIQDSYTSYQQIPWKKLLPYENTKQRYKTLKKEARIGQLRGYFLAFVLMDITSYLFCYGLDFFNIHLKWFYGFLSLGILLCFSLSYIPNKKVYFLSGLLELILLILSIFVFPPFYIWDININPIFVLLILLPCLFMRYIEWEGLFSFLQEFLLMVFVLALSISITILFEFLLNYEIFFISILLLAGYLYYLYRHLYQYFNSFAEYKQFLKELL